MQYNIKNMLAGKNQEKNSLYYLNSSILEVKKLLSQNAATYQDVLNC